MGLIDRIVKDSVDKVIREDFPKMLEDAISERVPIVMRKSFNENPNRELSRIGFLWAGALYLQDYWPDISIPDASFMVGDFLNMSGIEWLDPDYDWSASAAKVIAREISEAS